MPSKRVFASDESIQRFIHRKRQRRFKVYDAIVNNAMKKSTVEDILARYIYEQKQLSNWERTRNGVLFNVRDCPDSVIQEAKLYFESRGFRFVLDDSKRDWDGGNDSRSVYIREVDHPLREDGEFVPHRKC